MSHTNKIHYLRRQDINIDKWNECLKKADNALIYAQTTYLDNICTNWDGLVLNDYEAIMPLPWRKKWGFKYIYQPYFAPNLGLFGKDLSTVLTEACLNHIPKEFQYWDIDLNEKNKVVPFKKLQIRDRTNIFLELNKPYEVLFQNYKRLAKRKIQLAGESQLTVHKNINTEVIIQAYEEHYERKQRIIPHLSYLNLVKSINLLPKENYQTYLIKKNEEVVAFYLVLVDDLNVYSLIGGSTKKGKEHGAFYMVTDAVIKDFSSSERKLRFEGSDMQGIAFFNLQFGSYPVQYQRIKQNSLPWPFHYFK